METLALNIPMTLANSNIGWAVILLAIALVLLFIEIFVPSGGIIMICGLVAMAAGVFFLFKVDTTVGMIGAIIAVISLPLILAFGMKMLPNTPFFKMLELRAGNPEKRMGKQGIAGADGNEETNALVGSRGEALTDLRPIGVCLISGRRRDCLATGGMIGKGSSIEVVAADGMQVKVRELV